ncbi:YdcF family protein [Paenibacillus sp. sgz500958]|uniref:YdcF family protein n=1 Tax=Paenibacillus sp. sgz500958 TaxID=3242475 RepID=UPI0036D22BDF
MSYGVGGSSPIRMVSRRRKFSSGRWPRKVLLVLIILGLLWCALTLWKINGAETSNPMTGGDAGIILGMAMWGDEPSPGLKERLDYGLKLYQEGKFKNFIVTGGLDQKDFKYTEGEGMRNYLIQQGVPESNIYVENEATTTYENLQFSKEIMDSEGWSSAVIITHTFHGRRAQEMAEEMGYGRIELGLTDSQTMSMLKYKTREILAYTKWKGQQLLLQFD